ncbi:DUF7940 domain-containing protein [Chitinasiproducens palmae]|uniref:Uncharacterized protein n=1 Tax=Chitinasiproducens palmae TaxID=1770053 RepID=A0A1H2PRR3_9BURK|nr:hypothetical protein [Chitinasiproducens palmae]SDV49176.1 hypothetical protein SAMN05216551_107129 [Chitinasiproducens palmae]
MKLQVIRDPAWRARIAGRWSVKLMAVGAAFTAAWAGVTAAGLTATFPAWFASAVAGIIFACGLGAAFLHQPNLPPAPGAPDNGPDHP